MQIDIHHAAAYVAARCAGFSHDDAAIVAYAAQYTDDASVAGTIKFDNAAQYSRIASSYASIDGHNLDSVEGRLVWLPFHFLPGNGGLKPGADPQGKFIEKIICRPGNRSYVAKDMVAAALKERQRPSGLYRLGITIHVFADTWSHQGFAGVLHPVNDVNHLEDTGSSGLFSTGWIQDLLAQAIPPLGHGRAKVFADMPFLSWRYRNARDEMVARNNTDVFCEALNECCKVMQRYRRVAPSGIPAPDREKIRGLFTSLKIVDGDERHARWCEAIARNPFSFGPAEISYDAKGQGSWKAAALGTSEVVPVYPYDPAFLRSHWKLFHDALQQHRLTLLHEILPKYGICAG